MNIDLRKKLRIDTFSNFSQMNMPKKYLFDLNESTEPEVIFYFVSGKEDVMDLQNHPFQLPSDNRVIVIFEKGKKLRDELKPLINNGFKMKAPMLCSISKELSGFCFLKTDD